MITGKMSKLTMELIRKTLGCSAEWIAPENTALKRYSQENMINGRQILMGQLLTHNTFEREVDSSKRKNRIICDAAMAI